MCGGGSFLYYVIHNSKCFVYLFGAERRENYTGEWCVNRLNITIGGTMRINTFIPNWTNKQFINMLAKRYNVNKSKFSYMKKKQLIAIYCNSNFWIRKE